MTATAFLWMCHKGVSWGARSRGVYDGRDLAERNAFQPHNSPHNSPHFTPSLPIWISWLLCTHRLSTTYADWMCSGNGSLYQEEIKIRWATPQADSSVQLRLRRGARGGWGGWADWTFVQGGKALLLIFIWIMSRKSRERRICTIRGQWLPSCFALPMQNKERPAFSMRLRNIWVTLNSCYHHIKSFKASISRQQMAL